MKGTDGSGEKGFDGHLKFKQGRWGKKLITGSKSNRVNHSKVMPVKYDGKDGISRMKIRSFGSIKTNWQ